MSVPDLSLQRINIIIPDGVRHDGVQDSKRGPLLCFTVLSIGASFSVLESEITNTKLARMANELREQFEPRPTFNAALNFLPPDPVLMAECVAKRNGKEQRP